MASSSGNIQFQISFQGLTNYNDWNVRCIDLEFDGLDVISACISGDIPSSTEQLLQFQIRHGFYQRSFDRISLTPELANTLKLSARMFQFYECSNRLTVQPDGSVKGETRAKRRDLPIPASSIPEFKEGDSFRIKTVNNGLKLDVVFFKVDETTSDGRSEECPLADLHEVEMAMMSQGALNSRNAYESLFGRDFSGDYQGRVETDVEPVQSCSELDVLEVSELQKRFDVVKARHQEAKIRLGQVCFGGDEETSWQVFDEKGDAFDEMEEIAHALERQGFPIADFELLY
ncbi:MAG: hypothetical protein V4492_06015 [Chlamydiota bacterium]